MCKRYYVVNEFGDDVGKAWLDVERCCYVVQIFSLGKELIFTDFDEMENYLWGLGFCAI